jgi:putative RecB family exonuclease
VIEMQRYSHSKIESFKQCPKKYELAYIRRMPKTTRGIEAYLGSRVHEALEWLYEHVCMGRVPEVTEVLQRYRERWDAEWDPCVRIARKGFTATDYRVAGERLIKDYYARHHPFDRGTTVGLEIGVQLELDSERIVRGIVDRLVKVSDGVWEIHDYKTGRSLPTQEQADADRQLALYQLAVERMYPDAQDVTLVWHYLFHDQEIRSRRTPDRLEALLDEVRADIAEIESATEYPTNVTKLCGWCDYQGACPAWQHEIALEEAGPGAFEEDEDAALVERFSELSDRLGELKREREEIRDELLRRMRQRGLESLAGSEHRVRVSRSACASIPSAGDAARRELEAILKDVGLWDRFSKVDARGLRDALADPEIPEEVRQDLARYVTIEERETLRCSMREG